MTRARGRRARGRWQKENGAIRDVAQLSHLLGGEDVGNSRNLLRRILVCWIACPYAPQVRPPSPGASPPRRSRGPCAARFSGPRETGGIWSVRHDLVVIGDRFRITIKAGQYVADHFRIAS